MTKRDSLGGWVKNSHFQRDVIRQWLPYTLMLTRWLASSEVYRTYLKRICCFRDVHLALNAVLMLSF